MDKIVLKSINFVIPSFVPPAGELETVRQAIERLAYRTIAITVHLLILWPVHLIVLLSLLEGTAWVTGFKSTQWIPYIWYFSQTCMGTSLFSYCKDVPEIIIQLDKLLNPAVVETPGRPKVRDHPLYVDRGHLPLSHGPSVALWVTTATAMRFLAILTWSTGLEAWCSPKLQNASEELVWNCSQRLSLSLPIAHPTSPA